MPTKMSGTIFRPGQWGLTLALLGPHVPMRRADMQGQGARPIQSP